MTPTEHQEPWQISGLSVELSAELPAVRLGPWPAVSAVFVHSANYRMSLGSGSSHVVYEIIQAEVAEHGSSQVEREMARIRRTPVGEARRTSGGRCAPDARRRADGQELFDAIVHAVIPGPRIDRFEERLVGLLRQVLELALATVDEGRRIDLCLPIFGVNNFGYPLEQTCRIVAGALVEGVRSSPVRGRVVLWANPGHWPAMSAALDRALEEE